MTVMEGAHLRNGRGDPHKAMESGQYVAIGGKPQTNQGEHRRGDKEDEGRVRVLLRWQRATHGPTSAAGGGHRDT